MADAPRVDVVTLDGFRAAALEHRATLLRVAARLTGDAHAAEDVVQDALAAAFAGRAAFRGEAGPRAWLCGIVVNLARRELRRRRLRRVLSLGLLVEAGSEAEPAAPGRPDALAQAERAAALRAAIATLPDGQRDALVLVSQEGLSAREAAEALGSTEAAVWQAVSRARAALRRVLREEEGA